MAPDLSDFRYYPLLRADGSNFASWYENLRRYLKEKNLLFTIEQWLGPEPDIMWMPSGMPFKTAKMLTLMLRSLWSILWIYK